MESNIRMKYSEFLNGSNWAIDESGITTPSHSGHGNNGNEEVTPYSPKHQNWSLAWRRHTLDNP